MLLWCNLWRSFADFPSTQLDNIERNTTREYRMGFPAVKPNPEPLGLAVFGLILGRGLASAFVLIWSYKLSLQNYILWLLGYLYLLMTLWLYKWHYCCKLQSGGGRRRSGSWLDLRVLGKRYRSPSNMFWLSAVFWCPIVKAKLQNNF